MRRYRNLQIEREKTPEEIALDHLFELNAKIERKHSAYREACSFDQDGQPAQADDALRRGGVLEEEIQQRRKHIEWWMRQGVIAKT